MSGRSINITTVSKSISGKVTLPGSMTLLMKMTELYLQIYTKANEAVYHNHYKALFFSA